MGYPDLNACHAIVIEAAAPEEIGDGVIFKVRVCQNAVK